MRLRFLCEVTRAPAGEGYEVPLPPDWLRSLGPALAVGASILSNPLVAIVAKSAVGAAIEQVTSPHAFAQTRYLRHLISHPGSSSAPLHLHSLLPSPPSPYFHVTSMSPPHEFHAIATRR